MRTDDIRRKFGRELVVQVVFALIFGEIFGVVQFAYVVIQRGGAGKFRIFAQRDGTFFRQLRYHGGVVVSARRFLFELFEKRRIQRSEFAQAEHRKHGEHGFEQRQKKQEQHRRGDTADEAVAEVNPDVARRARLFERAAARSYGRNFKQEHDEIHRRRDEKPHEHHAEAGTQSVCRENGDHAAGKGDHQRRIDALRGRRYRGKVIENKQQQRVDDIHEHGAAPAEKNKRKQRAKRHGARVYVEPFAREHAQNKA